MSAAAEVDEHHHHVRRPGDQELRFVVYCVKHDGRRTDWMRYATRAESVAVAEALQRVGCAATVEEVPS